MFDAIVRHIELPDVAWFLPVATGHTWYPNRFMEPLAVNQPQLDHALARVAALSADLATDGFGLDRQIVMGFSQGACLGCEYVWRSGERHRALIALTGGLIGPPGTRWPAGARDFGGMPVFLSNRDDDPWVPAARTRESSATFRSAGARVTERIAPGAAHEIDTAEIASVRTLLSGAPVP
jgi:phospholipase/carboxylesterase